MPKKAELVTEQKQAKARLAAANREAKKAANALAEGERKLHVQRATMDELEARMANSEEVNTLVKYSAFPNFVMLHCMVCGSAFIRQRAVPASCLQRHSSSASTDQSSKGAPAQNTWPDGLG